MAAERPATRLDTAVELPSGVSYWPAVVSDAESSTLVSWFATLPFKPFAFHGYLANRRIVSFGWRYDYAERTLRESEAVPEFLHPLRVRAAALASLVPQGLKQVLITEYAAGAGIGWHRDKPMFEHVIAFSFLSPCLLRLRLKRGSGWKRSSLVAEPGSAYLLRGPARREWEHSIPPVAALRYSVTFRDFTSSRCPP